MILKKNSEVTFFLEKKFSIYMETYQEKLKSCVKMDASKNIKKRKKAIEVLQGANQYLGIILNFFQKKIIGKIMHLIKYQLLNMTRGYQIKPIKKKN